MNDIKKRGGKREGAGRKPSGLNREKFIIYIDDAEKIAIKNIVATMRNDFSAQQSNIIEEKTEIDFNAQQSNEHDKNNMNLVHDNQKILDKLKANYENDISVLESKYDNRVQELTDEIGVLQSSLKYHKDEINTLKSKFKSDIEYYINEISTLKSDHEYEISVFKSNLVANNESLQLHQEKLDIDSFKDLEKAKTENNIQPEPQKSAIEIIEKMSADKISHSKIADYLNNIGLKTLRNKTWTKSNVQKIISRKKENSISEVPGTDHNV